MFWSPRTGELRAAIANPYDAEGMIATVRGLGMFTRRANRRRISSQSRKKSSGAIVEGSHFRRSPAIPASTTGLGRGDM